MEIANNCQLTYCTNIHPGEDWPTLFAQLKNKLPPIKQAVCPRQPFGLGLRLSAQAAKYLCTDTAARNEFKTWLGEHQLYIFTLNGFPYGTFHKVAVKEQVYQPDWQTPQRFEYSCDLALLLSEFLPENSKGSISTVPIGFRSDFDSEEKMQTAANTVLDFVCFLIALQASSGKTIQLALEPEPGCLLETTAGTIDFFQQYLLSPSALAYVQKKLPNHCTPAAISQNVKAHLGICLDTCHAAVMFESATDAARQILSADIPIHKIQLTAALQVNHLNDRAQQQLHAFVDPVYLHQTSVMAPGTTKPVFYLDLPEALASAPKGAALRSHFHVPVFYSEFDELQTTQTDLINLIQQHNLSPLSPHLEVETYTFDVLPQELQTATVTEAISREILWVKELLE